MIEEGDYDDEPATAALEDDEEEEEEEDYDDESVSELITRTVDFAGIVGDNTDVVFIGGIILAVIIAFGKTLAGFSLDAVQGGSSGQTVGLG